MNILKILLIILCVLLYWKFVYYKYHKRDFTPISYFIFGGILVILGIYFFAKGWVSFSNVRIIYLLMAFSLLGAFTLVSYGVKKKGLVKDVDITLTWAKKTFPKISYHFWLILAFPAIFFMIISTRHILGEEFIFFWLMILLAHTASNYRLYRYIKKKNPKK